MRVFCLLFFLLSEFATLSQSTARNFSISPIVGFKIHNNRLESLSFAGPAKVLVSVVIGGEISYKKFPFTLSYQRDYLQRFWHYAGPENNEDASVREIWEEDQIHLYWHLKYLSLGLGHYWKQRENELNHWSPGSFVQQRRGFQLSITYPTHWLDIEIRTKLQYDPDFAGLAGLNNYYLYFLYRIGAKRKTKPALKFLTVNGVIGSRVFLHEVKIIPGELFNKPLGFAPSFGVEFLFHKIGLSLNAEKDWWISFNGGSPRRDVKGLVYSSFIGARYHLLLKNGRHIRFGLGGSWIEDNENKLENITLTPTPEQQKLGNFQVKGLGITLSYEILPYTDLEFKTTLPFIGEEIFENRSRSSLGIFYRFNPLRGKG